MAYADFQTALIENPGKGDVIPGAAPICKVRWGDQGRDAGKRGGIRVIYLHIPDIQVLYLADVYGKDEADDLTTDEKKIWRDLHGIDREP